MRCTPLLGAILLGAMMLAGCGAAKNAAIEVKESFGYAKRKQLVAAVKDTREEQQEAKEQFADALEEFIAVTGAKTGELESRYKSLKSRYDDAESQAKAVRTQIADTERVAGALFKEWRGELEQYSSQDLRRSSEQQMNQTQREFDRLVTTMHAAADKMDPVLAAFKDQVLYLKHNLNARAIASLQSNADKMQTDVTNLIREMEKAIKESTDFIDRMQQEG